MLNAHLFIDGAAFFAGTVGLSKTPFATSIQRPINLSGFALSSATSAFAFAATSQRSEAEKAAALACTILLLCLIAKPLAQRTTILLNPYAVIQLTAFHTLLKVTLYGIYKLAQHFTVSVSFNPTTTEDIKKISVSELGTRKAELERSMEEKWDTFNLNMQAAFNVMLVENGQTALPFTNYTRVALLSEKELQVFQNFVGEHAKNKEQSQVLFDHDLPPPKQFDALPDLSPTTVDIPTLSSSQLLWYYQAFCKKLALEAQVSPFTLSFYHADLLPPTSAFFTPLPIPSKADNVSVNQAHYFVNYDRHHPEAFDKQTEKKQAILNAIFVKAGKKPYPLKKPEEPPIESPSWSTAKKAMIYGGCALALIAIPTALFLMGPTTPITPSQEDHSQPEINKTSNVFNDTIPVIEDQPLPLVNQSSISLAEESSPMSIYFPLPQEQLPEAHKVADVYDAPCFPEVPQPTIHEIFPQEKFKIDLSHLIPKPYEPTPPDRTVSLLYPSLESRYAVCSPDEKPQQSLVPLPVTHETFPQETFKIDLSHPIPKPYEPTPPDCAVSLLYPSLESRYAVSSFDEKPLPPTNHSPTPIDLITLQSHEELFRPYVHELPQLPNNLNFVHQTITNPHSLPQANPASYSWKYLSLLAVPIVAVIAGITKIASGLLRKPHRKKETRQLVSISKTPPRDLASSSTPLHLQSKPISGKITTHPTIDFRGELYLKPMHEHEMCPACEVDNTLWERDFHNLPRAFEKLSHYTIQTLTGVEVVDSELSTIGEKFSEEELDRIAKLVAKVTAEKAKVSWNDIESFSFDFHRLGPNFTCVMVRVQTKESACQRLHLPVNLFTDVHYTYPPRSEHKEEPLPFDKSIELSLGEELSLQAKLKGFLTKLSKVTVQCESWTSQKSWTLENEDLERLPYDLTRLLKIRQSDKVEDGSWRQACTVVQALARKVAEEKFKTRFEEIDSYDLQILKNKSMITFIVTVTLNDKKAADACTFASLKQLKKAVSNL